MRFVEIHSHILPGVDDGAENVSVSVEMLRTLKRQGAVCVYATPHYDFLSQSIDTFTKKRDNAYSVLKRAMAECNPDDICPVFLGAEVMYSSRIGEFTDLSRLTYGDTPFILFELDGKLPKNFANEMKDISQRYGVTPILAHTERYKGLGYFRKLSALSDAGILFQVNYESFLPGAPFGKTAAELMRNGFVDFFGTDTHGMKKRTPNFEESYKRLVCEYGQSKTDKIVSRSYSYFGQ